ncbi:MAG: hypothetical protein LBK68_02380 [Candidatus Margulisbacteria bacterium]|nr:hypothetical protein [Candidatus Margulisiibacteriota bacterium]
MQTIARGLGAGLGSPQEAFSFGYFFVAGGQRNNLAEGIKKSKKEKRTTQKTTKYQ